MTGTARRHSGGGVNGVRRVGAALAAAGLALGWLGLAATPAAARPPTVSFSSPSAGATVKDSSPTVAGSAEIQNGVITEISVTFTSPDGHPVPPTSRVSGDDRSNVSFSISPSLPYNGRYSVTARATGEDRPVETNGAESATAQRDFKIEAPPQRPAGVKATVDEQTRVVTVSWRANNEPDMVGYQVQRAVGDSTDWTVAGNTNRSQTSFDDARTSERGGDYRYRVVAVRQGASSGSGVTSEASSTSSVTVADPPKQQTSPTTTASRPDSGPSGDGDGGSAGGSGGTSGGSGGTSGGSRGGTSGGGSGGSGGGSSSGGSSPNIGPVITRSQKVDLSGFTTIMDQTQAPRPRSSTQPDAGYDENLPFGEVTVEEPVEPGEGEVSAAPIGIDEDTDPNMLRFVAAGLLATVLLMHMVWLKGEVDRVPLEALPAEAVDGPPPAG